MAFWLLPLIVLSFILSLVVIERNRAHDILPSAIVIQAVQDGQTFISYRNAVALYQQNNPVFTGTVTAANLTAQGSQFSSAFLAVAGNAITAVGTSGRVITCYAALTTGAIAEALRTSENDLSIGIASGTTWTSTALGASAVPVTLATTVPNGNIVSVVQVGG